MSYDTGMADKDRDKGEDDAPPNAGMTKQDMKRLLARARRGAVTAALGQGDAKSGGHGLILLDRVMPPKQVLKALKEQFPTGSKFCFGSASVDTDADPKLVTFRMNRRVPGLDRRLRKSLKGTGYSRVAIQTGKAPE